MKSRIRSFKEIRPVEAAPTYAEIRTDRPMDMTQVASTSCDNAKAPEERNIIKAEDRVNNGKLQARIKGSCTKQRV